MSAEARRLAALSALLLQLHQGSPRWPLAQCQARTLDLLADLLPLHGALWSTEVLGGPSAGPADAPAFDSLVAHGAATTLQAAYLAGAHRQDRLRAAACAQPGQPVLLRLDTALADAPPAAAAPADLLQAHGVCWALGIALDDSLSGRRHLLLLWRQAGLRRFSATDQLLLRCVAPHAVLALQACAGAAATASAATSAATSAAEPADPGSTGAAAGLPGGRFTPALARPPTILGASAGPAPHGPAGAALHHARCDGQGLLQQIDPGAFALLRQEWPQWSATQLPQPLADALRHSAAAAAVRATGTALPSPMQRWQGRHITVLWQHDAAGLRLSLRRRLAQDGLSARQREIAQAYAAGHTGPQIAAGLGLSASTVNNHLGDIFKKLGVRSKLALARQLAGGL